VNYPFKVSALQWILRFCSANKELNHLSTKLLFLCNIPFQTIMSQSELVLKQNTKNMTLGISSGHDDFEDSQIFCLTKTQME